MSPLPLLTRNASAFAYTALNLLFPPHCAACDAAVEHHGTLCESCWQKAMFLSEPACARCGLPFELGAGRDILCGECLQSPPPFAAARSVLRYDDVSRRLIVPLKYSDQTHGVPTLAAWMARAGASFIPLCDAAIPVPIAYRRLLKRTYNQAGLLAAELAKGAAIPVWYDVLIRQGKKPPQEGLSRAERFKNVRGAFAVPAQAKEKIRSKTLLLVDDVMTTGATLQTCAQALLDAGARDVYVLTLARTLKA